MAKYREIWNDEKLLENIEQLIKGNTECFKIWDSIRQSIIKKGRRYSSGYNFLIHYDRVFYGSSGSQFGRDLIDVLNDKDTITGLASGHLFDIRMNDFILSIKFYDDSMVTNTYQNTTQKEGSYANISKRFVQSFAPIVGDNPVYLILGTAPGEKSLKIGQYYSNKGNRFWAVLGQLYNVDLVSMPYEAKVTFLKSKRIAIWDTLKECIRSSSKDEDIENNPLCNDIDAFIQEHPTIQRIIFNGNVAGKYYKPKVSFYVVPSTSPLNKRWYSMDKILELWGKALEI